MIQLHHPHSREQAQEIHYLTGMDKLSWGKVIQLNWCLNRVGQNQKWVDKEWLPGYTTVEWRGAGEQFQYVYLSPCGRDKDLLC